MKEYKKVFNDYKKLSDRDKLIFKNELDKLNELEYLEKMEKRVIIADSFMRLIDEDGETFFKKDWIVKHILKIDEDTN